MAEEKNKPIYKVVDRHRFAGDGRTREKAEETQAREIPSPAESPSVGPARTTKSEDVAPDPKRN